MSLLMDALKKAEKARQAKAETDESPVLSEPAETQGFSLDPLDETPAPPPSMELPELDLDAEPPEQSRAFAFKPFLDEESGDDAAEDLESTSFGEAVLPPSDGALDPESSQALPPALSLVDEEVLSDDTSATLPSAKAAQASVEDYFDGTHSVSMSMEQVRAAMDDEDTAERRRGAGAEPASPRAAQTVFDAKTPAKPRSSGFAFGIAAMLLVVVGAGGGGYFYWKNFLDKPPLVPRARVEPRPVPAPPVEPTPAPPVQTAATASPAAEPPTPAQAPADAVGITAPSVAEVMETSAQPEATIRVPIRGDLTPKSPEPEPEPEPPADRTAESEMLANAMVGTPGDVVENLAKAIERAGAGDPTRLSGGIKIEKASGRNRTNELVTRAYADLQAGDGEAAEKSYRRVLQSEPRNRDALLGLAAVAARSGRWDRAAAQYMQVLTYNPRDSVAQAALISLQERGDLGANESQLKLLIENEPEASHLHFGLGNLYAEQARWPQAQAAFFSAYRHEPANADYAFNLAVSLDHLGQAEAALQYYRRALELADVKFASFQHDAVLERIRVMTTAQ